MPEITDEQRAAEAVACPYCQRKERELRAELRSAVAELGEWKSCADRYAEVCKQRGADLRAAVDALREFANEANWFDAADVGGFVPGWRGPNPDKPESFAAVIVAAYDAHHPEGE